MTAPRATARRSAPPRCSTSWTFDGEGRITDLVQFVDTALLTRMLAEHG
jgi:hypothetical protein